METIPNLTEEEIENLKEAAGNIEEWNNLCDEIKRIRDEQYLPDWLEVVIAGGIIQDKIKITIIGVKNDW